MQGNIDNVKRGASFVLDMSASCSAGASLISLGHMARCIGGVHGVNPKVSLALLPAAF